MYKFGISRSWRCRQSYPNSKTLVNQNLQSDPDGVSDGMASMVNFQGQNRRYSELWVVVVLLWLCMDWWALWLTRSGDQSLLHVYHINVLMQLTSGWLTHRQRSSWSCLMFLGSFGFKNSQTPLLDTPSRSASKNGGYALPVA